MNFRRVIQMTEKINPVFFKAFLIIGFLTGIFIGSLSASAASSRIVNDPQQNYLIALVENAQDEDSPLLALWLAATYLESGEISWMPIYPQPLEAENVSFSEMHDPVWVKPQITESWQSLELLNEQEIRWDEIIVLDNEALAVLGSFIQRDNELHSASTWIEPQNALYQQVGLIQEICEQSQAFNNPAVLDQLLLLIANPANMHTSLSSFEFITMWDKLANKQFDVSCNHPWAD